MSVFHRVDKTSGKIETDPALKSRHHRSPYIIGRMYVIRFTKLAAIEIANLFQLFVMPSDSFVQRLVNYSTSCRLIRDWISILTDGRRYNVPPIAPAVGLIH
jgi:hypothetical protein